MHTNVNSDAAVGVMAFLGAAFMMGLAVIIILHALRTHRFARSRRLSFVTFSLLGFYLLVLLAFSLVSREKALAFGVEKHFCELDCHLAYSITNVSRTKTVGVSPNEVAAHGIFYVVAIRTRFDEYAAKTFRYV